MIATNTVLVHFTVQLLSCFMWKSFKMSQKSFRMCSLPTYSRGFQGFCGTPAVLEPSKQPSLACNRFWSQVSDRKYSSCWNADFCAADKREDSKTKHLIVASGISFLLNYQLIMENLIFVFFLHCPFWLVPLAACKQQKFSWRLVDAVIVWFPAFIWLSGHGIWSVEFALLSYHLL